MYNSSMEMVSILMPAFNASNSISGSIKSVIAQSYSNWELLIVDDGSTDGTCRIATGMAEFDSRIHVFKLWENQGASYARNFGLNHAKGRYIAFLDADDFWHPNKLSQQINYMKEKDAALCFSAYTRIDDQDRRLENVRVPSRISYHDLLKRNVIGCLTVVYDTTTIGKVPMPPFKRQQDYALWLSIIRRAGSAFGLDEDLAIYRVGKKTLSTNKVLAAQDIWRIFRQQERLNLLHAIYYFLHYSYFGLRYRLLQRATDDAPKLDTSFGVDLRSLLRK
ncbi:glycosyltransferase family 2 protein [Shimia sp. R10_1]|uniref:glycosyltransferase family 2 protein n=1 Tax=Shimia sp. R10_1 TaxID=2821095 RepID=UPI001ADC250E|nr:glycosyltransferase family 2 protein [Shimia sp. R10_1]MBO9473666.1 glycosyltransferase family 2 protein [Shimia sp. R10_1]